MILSRSYYDLIMIFPRSSYDPITNLLCSYCENNTEIINPILQSYYDPLTLTILLRLYCDIIIVVLRFCCDLITIQLRFYYDDIMILLLLSDSDFVALLFRSYFYLITVLL